MTIIFIPHVGSIVLFNLNFIIFSFYNFLDCVILVNFEWALVAFSKTNFYGPFLARANDSIALRIV